MAVWSILQKSGLAAGVRIDPEYYQPRYLEDARRLGATKSQAIHQLAFVTDGIHGSPDEVEEGGVRYLSAKCVKDNDFSLGDTLWISEGQHAANPRTNLQTGDVLLTTVGTIGNAAVVQPDLLPANADRHLGIIRVNENAPIDPYYLSTFLNSEFGRFQSLREATGNVQLNLFIEKIKELRVPIIRCAGEVSRLTKDAYRHRLEAGLRVAKAETLILSMLAPNGLDLSPSKTYTRSLKELLASNRFGAEYYMPCKRRVIEALSGMSSKPLSYYVVSVKESWNPAGASPAELVRNYNLTHALEPFLDDRQEPTPAGEILSQKKRFREGDVVISRLRSYLKEVAVVRSRGTIPSVGSSEFIVLRPIGELTAEKLLAFLRCGPVQTVLQWSQDGTNHPRFNERELLSIPVPDTVVRSGTEIDELVGEAISSRQEMRSLLSEAKAIVESEIRERDAAPKALH